MTNYQFCLILSLLFFIAANGVGANAAAALGYLIGEDLSFGDGVTIIHDDRREVTCWVASSWYGKGVSCIPESQLQAGNERQLSPHETQPEPTPALAPGRWIDERYEL
ncbi:hypothetical protein ABNP32_13465 [Pseudomonas viridiflava]